MAIFRCTKKLLVELKITSVPEITDEDFLSSWHAHFVRIERRKCVLFTHSSTLYSVMITCMRKPEFDNLGEVFRTRLANSLRWDGFPQSHIDALLDAHQEIEITKTNNRSVLGSMNDLIFQAKVHIAHNGGIQVVSQSQISHQLNRTPMSAIDLVFPDKAMRALLDERFGKVD